MSEIKCSGLTFPLDGLISHLLFPTCTFHCFRSCSHQEHSYPFTSLNLSRKSRQSKQTGQINLIPQCSDLPSQKRTEKSRSLEQWPFHSYTQNPFHHAELWLWPYTSSWSPRDLPMHSSESSCASIPRPPSNPRIMLTNLSKYCQIPRLDRAVSM